MFRNIALLCVLAVATSFAQVRDLFAEFEAEANAAESSSSSVPLSSSETLSSSSSVVSSSSEEKVSSSSLQSSSSEVVVLSSSSAMLSSSSVVEVSSSSVALSSAMESSSSVIQADSVSILSSSSEEKKNDSLQLSSSSALVDTSSLSSSSQVQADSSAISSSSVESSSSMLADSAVQVVQTNSSSSAASSSSISRRDILGPVKVSKVYGMDEIKGRYKSPRKALFMSLIIPGSGQLYVGGSTLTNVRGGVYLALEAALWSGWYYFSVHKYNDQVSKYKKFARKNFSIGTYEQKMHDIFYTLDGVEEEDAFRLRYLNSREIYCESIYGSAGSNGCYTNDKAFYNDANHTNRFKPGKTLGEDLKEIKLYDGGDFYQQISREQFVLGWLDVENETLPADLDLDDPNGEFVRLGESSAQKKYRSMRSKANDYADLQAWFFGGLILNHLVSALDAALTANAHNKTLYEEKLSWWDKMHLEGYIVPFRGERASVLNAYWSF